MTTLVISLSKLVVINVCRMRGCSMLGLCSSLCFYLINRAPLPIILMVLGIFAARKLAVGKLAARNFRRTRPEQTRVRVKG